MNRFPGSLSLKLPAFSRVFLGEAKEDSSKMKALLNTTS